MCFCARAPSVWKVCVYFYVLILDSPWSEKGRIALSVCKADCLLLDRKLAPVSFFFFFKNLLASRVVFTILFFLWDL